MLSLSRAILNAAGACGPPGSRAAICAMIMMKKKQPGSAPNKPKRVLYFDSISRVVDFSCQPKEIKRDQQQRPRKWIEMRDGM